MIEFGASGQRRGVVTANAEVARWWREVANVRVHGITMEQPAEALRRKVRR